MIATVTLYYDTGLGPGNSMDGVDKLALFTSRTFSDVAVKQDLMLSSLKLAASFNDVKGADFCKVNDMCYYITSLVMLNDNVAKLVLQPDFVTTVGITNLKFVSGWCKRRHVASDGWFSNTLDEDFTPQAPPDVVFSATPIKPSDVAGSYPIVVSSIKLSTISQVAQVYASQTGEKCLVPQLPDMISSFTQYTTKCLEENTAYSSKIAMTAAYNLEDSNVIDGMTALRSLGIESAISASYVLPKCWATAIAGTEPGAFGLISDRGTTFNSNLHVQYSIDGGYVPLNNKVYSGQFNKIKIYSVASGDSKEFSVEEIMANDLSIKWQLYADCKYNGAPGCKPRYINHTNNNSTAGAIRGANWQQTPFMYTSVSGSLFNYRDAIFESNKSTSNMLAGLLDAILNIASLGLLGGNSESKTASSDNAEYLGLGPLNTAQAGSGIASNIINNIYNQRAIRMNLRRQEIEAFGAVNFPEQPYIADYIGNYFYEAQSRLSAADVMRFDKYLNAYGYAADELADNTAFNCRQNFNYIQATEVTLSKAGVPMMLLNGVASEIEKGIRIWHVAPSISVLTSLNPIVSPVNN